MQDRGEKSSKGLGAGRERFREDKEGSLSWRVGSVLAEDAEVSCKETAGELDGTERGSGNMSMDDSSRSF